MREQKQAVKSRSSHAVAAVCEAKQIESGRAMEGWLAALGAAIATGIAGCLLIQNSTCRRLFADVPGTGPQKFHLGAIPRVGGLPILVGLVFAMGAIGMTSLPFATALAGAVLCGLCAFGGGLAEDLTKRVGVRMRLLLTFASAALGFVILDARIAALDVPGFDVLLQLHFVSFALTLFAIGGFANALNIVDGFNGLASICALIFLGAIAYVARTVGDDYLFWSSIVVSGAVTGFAVLNFPKGYMFLGDGGAYFLGFLIAEFAVLLVHRNSEVSPWFALTLLSYPVVETVFSAYRKRILRKQSPGEPDGLHLHMLIHKRLVRQYTTPFAWTNSATSPYLWVIAAIPAAAAALLWHNTAALQVVLAGFIVFYVWFYWRLVRFRSPKLLVMRKYLCAAGKVPVGVDGATELTPSRE